MKLYCRCGGRGCTDHERGFAPGQALRPQTYAHGWWSDTVSDTTGDSVIPFCYPPPAPLSSMEHSVPAWGQMSGRRGQVSCPAGVGQPWGHPRCDPLSCSSSSPPPQIPPPAPPSVHSITLLAAWGPHGDTRHDHIPMAHLSPSARLRLDGAGGRSPSVHLWPNGTPSPIATSLLPLSLHRGGMWQGTLCQSPPIRPRRPQAVRGAVLATERA